MLRCSRAMTVLATDRLDSMVGFYRLLLGLEPDPWQPGRYAEFCLPGLILGLFTPHPQQRELFLPPSRSLGLCLQVEDLAGIYDGVVASQLGQLSPLYTASHGREFYLYDPDGNRLIIHQPWE
jgi:predicted enzyme related to lactoylglutathione lyase